MQTVLLLAGFLASVLVHGWPVTPVQPISDEQQTWLSSSHHIANVPQYLEAYTNLLTGTWEDSGSSPTFGHRHPLSSTTGFGEASACPSSSYGSDTGCDYTSTECPTGVIPQHGHINVPDAQAYTVRTGQSHSMWKATPPKALLSRPSASARRRIASHRALASPLDDVQMIESPGGDGTLIRNPYGRTNRQYLRLKSINARLPQKIREALDKTPYKIDPRLLGMPRQNETPEEIRQNELLRHMKPYTRALYGDPDEVRMIVDPRLGFVEHPSKQTNRDYIKEQRYLNRIRQQNKRNAVKVMGLRELQAQRKRQWQDMEDRRSALEQAALKFDQGKGEQVRRTHMEQREARARRVLVVQDKKFQVKQMKFPLRPTPLLPGRSTQNVVAAPSPSMFPTSPTFNSYSTSTPSSSPSTHTLYSH